MFDINKYYKHIIIILLSLLVIVPTLFFPPKNLEIYLKEYATLLSIILMSFFILYITLVVYNYVSEIYENDHDYINAIMPLLILLGTAFLGFLAEFYIEDLSDVKTDAYEKAHFFLFLVLTEIIITILYYILNSIFIIKKQSEISYKIIEDEFFYGIIKDFSHGLNILKEKKVSGYMSSVEKDLIKQRLNWILNDINSYKNSEYEFQYSEYSKYWEGLIKKYTGNYLSIEDQTLNFDKNCGQRVDIDQLIIRSNSQAEQLLNSNIKKFEKIIVYNNHSVVENARDDESHDKRQCNDNVCTHNKCFEDNCDFNKYVNKWLENIKRMNDAWSQKDCEREAKLYIADYHTIDSKLRLENLDIGVFGDIAAGVQVNEIVKSSNDNSVTLESKKPGIKFTFYFKKEKVNMFVEFFENIKNYSENVVKDTGNS